MSRWWIRSLVLIAVFVVACGGSGDRSDGTQGPTGTPQPSSSEDTPTATAIITREPERPPPETVVFARQLDQWLATDNTYALYGSWTLVPISCEEPSGYEPNLTPTICSGAEEGEIRRGLWQSTNLHGEVVDPPPMAERHGPQDSVVLPGDSSLMDELGGGEWRLATVGCPRLAEALGCNQRFSVVFTYMRLNSASQPVRVVVAYEVEWKDDEERYMITRRRTQVTAIMFPAEAIEGGQRESDNPSTTGVWDSTFYPIEGA